MKNLPTEFKLELSNEIWVAGRAGAESSHPKTVGLTEPLALHHSVKGWLWLAMLGRSGWGRSPHSGPAMGCTAHKKKWLAVGFVYKRCGMFAPKTDLGNPSCHPCSSLCWQGFISQNSIISKPRKMDLEQEKDLLSWLANSVSFFFPLKSEEELFDSRPIFKAEKTCREVRHLPGVTVQQRF